MKQVEQWAERKIGRRLIRSQDGTGYLFTSAELDKLVQPSAPSILKFLLWFAGGYALSYGVSKYICWLASECFK